MLKFRLFGFIHNFLFLIQNLLIIFFLKPKLLKKNLFNFLDLFLDLGHFLVGSAEFDRIRPKRLGSDRFRIRYTGRKQCYPTHNLLELRDDLLLPVLQGGEALAGYLRAHVVPHAPVAHLLVNGQRKQI